VAFSEVYVDPSIAADSGTGTIGDPYGDLEYAIRQTTFDTTNGTRVNIKAGAAEVLAAELSTGALADTVTTPAWAYNTVAVFVLQGYTSVAGDGGLASITLPNTVTALFDSVTASGVHIADLVISGDPSSRFFRVDDYNSIQRCSFVYTGSASNIPGVLGANYVNVSDCYFSGFTSFHLILTIGGSIRRCHFDHTQDIVTVGGNVVQPGYGTVMEYNTIRYHFASNDDAIQTAAEAVVCNNSIYGYGGSTGAGIVTGLVGALVENNLIEGFSGVGGAGVKVLASNHHYTTLHGNAIYDCTTPIDASNFSGLLDYGDNEVLTASPFNDAANGDFSPADVGNVKEGALPNVIGGGFV